MKKVKAIGILTAAVMSLSMTACGDGDSSAESSTEEGSEISEEYEYSSSQIDASVGQTMTWGSFSFFVPDGMTLKGGDVFDENDPRYFSVRKSELSYFDFKEEDDDANKMDAYNYNKKTYTNGQFDVEDTYNGIKWTGFQYDAYGTPAFEAYAEIDGVFLRVSCTYCAFDDEISKAILGSVKVDPNGGAGGSAAETTAETEPEPTAPAAEIAETIEMKNAKVGIPKGYTVMKDGAPVQYVMTNDETGGKIAYWSSSGTAEEEIDKTIGSLEGVQKQTWTIGGNDWTGYCPYDNAYILAVNIGDGNLLIDMDYGSMEELETLISCIELKNE